MIFFSTRITIRDRVNYLTRSFQYLPRGMEPFDVQRLTLPESGLSRCEERRTMARLTRRQRIQVRALRGSSLARACIAEFLNVSNDKIELRTADKRRT